MSDSKPEVVAVAVVCVVFSGDGIQVDAERVYMTTKQARVFGNHIHGNSVKAWADPVYDDVRSPSKDVRANQHDINGTIFYHAIKCARALALTNRDEVVICGYASLVFGYDDHEGYPFFKRTELTSDLEDW